MIYTHVLNRGSKGIRSPADGLAKGFQVDSAEVSYHSTKFVLRSQALDINQFQFELGLCDRLNW